MNSTVSFGDLTRWCVVDPDVMLDGIARHHRKADGTSEFHTYRTFFEQAAAGTLPNFVWIAPNGTTMDHPCEVCVCAHAVCARVRVSHFHSSTSLIKQNS